MITEEKYDSGWLSYLDKYKCTESEIRKFKFFEKQNSDTLLICLSGTGKFVLFDFYNTFAKKDICKNIDVLFALDKNKIFYLTGISGLSSSADQTVQKIIELCKYKNYKKLLFVGTSMGGFGCILHALLLPKIESLESVRCLVFNSYTAIPNHVIATAKESIDANLFFYMQQRGLNKQNIYEMLIPKHNEYQDLKNIIDQYNSSDINQVEINVLYGHPSREILRANILSNFKNVKLKMFQITNHNIASVLQKQGILEPILNKFINNTLFK